MVSRRRHPTPYDASSESLAFLGWRVAALAGIAVVLVSTLYRDRDADVPRLLVPVRGVEASELVDSFRDRRSGGRRHEAIDIPAPRGTPVVAATDGRLERMVSSPLGGLSVYQLDEARTLCLYYAHLDGYATGVSEGDALRRGEIIGYVGTTGNAPDSVPHLHFAVLAGSSCSHEHALDPLAFLR